MPVVVLGELHSGFRAGTRRIENEELLMRFLGKSSVRIVNVTEETALRYAEVDVLLRKKGRPIPRNDVWIAALVINLETADACQRWAASLRRLGFRMWRVSPNG
jgi:predicted nucleic acid-binding protein